MPAVRTYSSPSTRTTAKKDERFSAMGTYYGIIFIFTSASRARHHAFFTNGDPGIFQPDGLVLNIDQRQAAVNAKYSISLIGVSTLPALDRTLPSIGVVK
jgi:hypothetical protein